MEDKPFKILLIEDDPGDVLLMQEMLAEAKDAPFDLEYADQLSTGLERLAAGSIDAVLLDLFLPDSQEFDTFVKVHTQAPGVPIIIMTGLDDETFGVNAVQAGAQDYLIKGQVDSNLLVRAIRYAIERKQLEDVIKASEERYRAVVKQSADCIFLVDVETLCILDSNPALQRLLGYTSDELLELTLYDFVAHEKGDVDEKIRLINAAHDHFLGERRYRKKDGTLVDMEASVNLISYGEKKAMCIVSRDITQRKQVQERQKTLLKELESANQELKDFAYIVSHDLKAPLRGISSLANWISTDYRDKLDDEGQELLNLLIGRTKRMDDLIDGILQYSRVGRIKEEKISVDLNTLVPEVIDLIAPPENITIEVENELPRLLCEKTHIQQIFQNLLSNAVKYMDKPKGMIKIGSILDGNYWRFSVSDNGPGIEEKYFEKIFLIFQTLAPRDELESTGVGLALVKKIIEMYGGEIWIESKSGDGSTFFFTLPQGEVR